jgi:hypothetical protein
MSCAVSFSTVEREMIAMGSFQEASNYFEIESCRGLGYCLSMSPSYHKTQLLSIFFQKQNKFPAFGTKWLHSKVVLRY